MKHLVVPVAAIILLSACSNKPHNESPVAVTPYIIQSATASLDSIHASPEQIGAAIEQQLPSGWKCLYDNAKIVITREEPVWFIGLSAPAKHT